MGDVTRWSTDPASNDLIDPACPWQEGMSPGQVNDSARGMMAAIAALFSDQNQNNVAVLSGSTYSLQTQSQIATLPAVAAAVQGKAAAGANSDITALNALTAEAKAALVSTTHAVVNGIDRTYSGWVEYLDGGKANRTSPAFDGTPTAPTPGDTAAALEVVTAAFVKRQLPFIPFQRHGILGDGSASDMTRLNNALAEMAETKKALVPEPGRDYNIGAQIVLPDGARIKSHPKTLFHFRATDAFNSTSKPGNKSTSGVLILADGKSDVVLDDFRMQFHPQQYSYVHGISTVGGRHIRLNNLEAFGWNSGSIVCATSTLDIQLSNPNIHDCTLDFPTGNNAEAQLSGFSMDDDRLSVDGKEISTTGGIFGGRIERLRATAQTLATGPGGQTDAITLGGNAAVIKDGEFIVDGVHIEEVYEGIDCLSISNVRGRNITGRNILYFMLKFVHGPSFNKFHNVTIDGVAKSAVVFFGSDNVSSDYPTQQNTVSRLNVRRLGDTSDSRMPAIGDPALIAFDDGIADPTKAHVKFNVVEDVECWNSDSRARPFIINVQSTSEGNIVRRLKHDGFAVRTGFGGVPTATILANRVAVDVGPQRPTLIGNGD